MGVHLIGVHLMSVHLMRVHFMVMYLIGVHLTGMHLDTHRLTGSISRIGAGEVYWRWRVQSLKWNVLSNAHSNRSKNRIVLPDTARKATVNDNSPNPLSQLFLR
jgi:hypothetical protein